MGGIISQVLSGGQSPGMRMLLVGLEGSGKTTFLRKLKNGQLVGAIPSVGYTEETGYTFDVLDECVSFVAWHAGAENKNLPDWSNPVFQNPYAIIFMVDSSEPERLPQARRALQRLNEDERLCDIPLLVFANKQDMPGAMSVEELTNKLGDQGQRPWTVQSASAYDGVGLYDGFQWLAPNVK